MSRKFDTTQISEYNTSHVYKKQYRVVTKDFFIFNREVVDSWKPYTNESLYKKELNRRKHYVLFKTGSELYFKNIQDMADHLGFTREAVRLCFNNTGVHKKSGYTVGICSLLK